MCKSDLMIQSYVEEIRFSIKMENFLIYTYFTYFFRLIKWCKKIIYVTRGRVNNLHLIQ